MTSLTADRVAGISASVAVKAPCRVATTANITLSGAQAIDGVAVVANDRVLVRSQTDNTENGIYKASASNWERSKDFDGNRDVVTGTLTYVRSGTQSGFWYVTSADPIVIDTSSITFGMASSVLAAFSAFMQTLLDDADADSFVQTLIAGLTAEATVAANDVVLLGDVSEGKGNKVTLSNLWKVITLLVAETAPAIDDELALYDLSAGTADKITLASLWKVINAFTADATPDPAADYVATYDASAAAAKKVLLSLIAPGPAATQAQMEAGSSLVTSVPPGRQHFHPGSLKAWGLVHGAGLTLDASYNLDSSTDGGVGDLTLTITNDLSSANYLWFAAGTTSAGFPIAASFLTTKLGSALRLQLTRADSAAAADPDATDGCSVEIVGDI